MIALACLAASAMLVWSTLRPERGTRGEQVRPLLVQFALALLAVSLLLRLASGPERGALLPVLQSAAALAGLVLWAALIRLFTFTPRRRDWIGNFLFNLVAILIALASPGWRAPALFALVAMWRLGWRRTLETRTLFRFLLGGLAVVVLAAWIGGGAVSHGPLRSLATFAKFARGVGLFYAAYALLAMLAQFVRDPSLGIRTVSRRLALSHVLVVAVPLLLTGTMWLATTVLGVAADRAIVAKRALEADGRALEDAMRAAIAQPATAHAGLTALAEAHRKEWPGLRAWRIESGRVERVRGDSVESEGHLPAWLDTIPQLPASGLVRLGSENWFGAVVRDSSASSRGAAVLIPVREALEGSAARVAGAKLAISSTLAIDADVDTLMRAGSRREADSLKAALRRTRLERARFDSAAKVTPAPPAAAEPETSDAARRALAITRRLGIPDSKVSTSTSRRNGISVEDDGQTALIRPDSGLHWSSGYALVPGVAWNPQNGWVRPRFLLTAEVEPRAALIGLFQNAAENPFNYVTLMALSGIALAFLVIIVFAIVMVGGMGRSITQATGALRVAAARLQAGDLAHRTEVRGQDDLWAVAEAFNHAAGGLERARALQKERDRFESELELARRIQARLLPAGNPSLAGLEIAGVSESAREVGGDYYDHIPLGDGRVLLVIADVSGKGVGAALLMSAFRASLMSQDAGHTDPASLASRLNEFLHRSVDPGKFVTAFVGILEGATGRLVYANAGHNPPVLLRAGGAFELLERGGLILGILAGSPFENGEVTLAPGDLVALYTDGVTEGADATGEQWGEDRLLDVLRRNAKAPLDTLVREIVSQVRAFEGEQGPADDITLLVARRPAG